MPEPQYNWVSKFTGFFMARKQISIALFLFLVLAGVTSLLNLRREGFPQVPVKIIAVSTVYKGAAASEVEQSITNPIESAIKDLKEVKSVASTSSESHSTVIITLDEKANVDSSLQNITSKVAGAELPKEANKPDIIQPTTGNSSFVFGLTGKNLTNEQLLAQGRIFEQEVSQIKGLKQVKLLSQFSDKITVLFDPAKLAAAGVDASKIQTSLAAANLNFPAGSDLTVDGSRATVLVAGRYGGVDEIADTPLTTISGRPVRLGDVASIQRGIYQDGKINHVGTPENDRLVSRTGIVYSADIRSDADILKVSSEIDDTLKHLRDEGTISKDLNVTRLFDDAESTSRQINEIKAGAIGEKWEGIGPLGYVGFLVGGIWLLMLAMFMFVNLRSALIAGVAIPLSFLFTLMALYFAGYTLNTLTLFSMILVLGLVVDPAIVVIESIQRYRDMGYSGREGVLAAVSSIGRGLLLATVCSIIVFTPFGLVTGIFGQIIRFIPITVIPALIASFFVPLIFLAPLASKLIKGRPTKPGSAPLDEDRALWAVSRWFRRANLFILHRLWLQIVIMLVAVTAPIGVTAYLFASGQVESVQFSKPHDTTEALVKVSYPANFTDTQIAELAKKTEDTLAGYAEIKNYYYMSQSGTSFNLHLNLTPINERSINASDLATKLKSELPHDASRQVYSSASTLSYGPPEQDFPVQIQIYDSDLAKIKTFALAVAEHTRQIKGVSRVSDGYTDGSTSAVQINLDKQAAAARGLNPATVGAQLASLLGEQNLTKISLGDTPVDVVARYEGADKYNTTAALGEIQIQSPTGPVALKQIASFTNNSSNGAIQHQNGQRFATVKAQVEPGTNSFTVQKQVNDWAKSQLATYHLRSSALESKGEGDDIAKSFTNLFITLGVAIVMIYLVLALFFSSFLKPIIITFALPLSFLGVFPVLAILDNQFGFLEILGLITLAGIVVNVGIFVIDNANHRVAAGVPAKEAIAQATAVRFRPIFLTKIVALGSLLPLAILSPFWRGLASVIIAGILTSGVLSLFTTPILYIWFTNLSKLPGKFSAWRSKP